MSFSVTTDQPAYPTTNTASCDKSSCNVQPTSSNPPQHRIDLGPQRRRVNPESLAARLGPELVAEMEKHIIPGSIEMPPFSVRRDIQVKFGIDRRHIYDFFHSRGLRCLNEKAMRNSYLEVRYQFTSLDFVSHGPQTKSQRLARSTITSPSTFPEPRKRRAAVAALEATSLKRTNAPRKQKGRQKRMGRPPSPVELDAIAYEPSFVLEEPEQAVHDMITDTTQEYPPSSDTSFLMSDVSCAPFFGQFSTFSFEETEAESEHTPCHSVSSLLDLSSSVSASTISTSSSMLSALSSESEIRDLRPKILPLSSQDRKAHYEWLDAIIGPASGIQESVGTYKAFMEHQREVFYNRLLMAEQPTKTSVPRRAPNEFISWVGGTPASGIPVHESRQPIAPHVDLRSTRLPPITPGATSSSSPGPSLPGGTYAATCRRSKTQGSCPLVLFHSRTLISHVLSQTGRDILGDEPSPQQ
jgi:hypothetical protein